MNTFKIYMLYMSLQNYKIIFSVSLLIFRL